MDEALQPRSLTGYVNWVRHEYRLEPPSRIHVRLTDAGGTPGWSGEFAAWIEGIGSPAAMLRDHEDGCAGGRECTCYYHWPLRAALWSLHGRFEESDGARMADFCLVVAETDWPLPKVAEAIGWPTELRWAFPLVAEQALWKLWCRYSPMPR